jgi:hypothetical protein
MDQQDTVPVEIPGVTFHVEMSGISGGTATMKNGYVRLRAEISDEQIWKDVLKRLDGYRVYAIDDFYQQLMISLRRENEALEKQLAKTKEELRTTNEWANNGVYQAELQLKIRDEEIKRLQQELLLHRKS